MELRLTLENLKQMTEDIEKERQQALYDYVHTDVSPPEYILHQLKADIWNKQTDFTYTLASYYRIYHRFGQKDAYDAILTMATEYRNRHFPAASISITDWAIYSQTNVVHVTLDFTLPWLSGQTNSHPQLT